MTYNLTTTDYSCPEHSDCTLTRFSSEAGPIGDRHTHIWVDKAGAWDRPADEVVLGQITVGLLYDFDPETGLGDFDPEAVHLVSSHDVAPAAPRLNETYPWANDHNTGKKATHPTAKVKLAKPPKETK